MRLIILILALVSLRYFPRRQVRPFDIYLGYVQRFSSWLRARKVLSSWLQVLILIFPWLFFWGLLHYFFAHWLGGFVGFLLGFIVLWYCLWPVSNEQLLVEGFHPTLPSVMIDNAGNMLSGDAKPHSVYREQSKAMLFQANEQTFALLFWFILLGGGGAILYRSIQLLNIAVQEDNSLTVVLRLAKTLQALLDWIPARLTALTYLIAGDFSAYHQWRLSAWRGLSSSEQLLVNVGFAALHIQIAQEQASAEENVQIIRLLDRSVLVWLVIVAIVIVGRAFF